MTNTITVIGRVGAPPEFRQTPWGDLEATFRLASSQRWRTKSGTWEEGETTWFTVRTLRHLAAGVRDSIEKGQQVVVTGRLRVRTWENERGKGFAVEIDADHVGPDLMFASATVRPRPRNEHATGASSSADGGASPHAPSQVATVEPASAEGARDGMVLAGAAPAQWATATIGAGGAADAREEPPF